MNMYRVIETEPGLWTVGYRIPYTDSWETDSDHGNREIAGDRARWLNGNLRRGLVYRQTGPGLWTVGHFDRYGVWSPDSDHEDREEAARFVAHGNGTDLAAYPEWLGPVARIEGG